MNSDREERGPSPVVAAILGIKEPDYLILEIPEELLRTSLRLIGESGWRRSDYPNYMYRLDPPRPDLHQLRHIAIARVKHTGTKSKQVSWNDNGSRHDRGSFNHKFDGMQVAKEIAREVLQVPDSVVFERSSAVRRLAVLVEQAEGEFPEGEVLCYRAVPRSSAD